MIFLVEATAATLKRGGSDTGEGASSSDAGDNHTDSDDAGVDIMVVMSKDRS